MPSRKSDPSRRSGASTSVATFAPIEDDSPAPTTAPTTAPATAPPTASPPAPSPAGLARPAMDTSMPPPSLPPPGLAQTPEAVIPPRPGSAASLPSFAAGPSQSTPSEKSKDDEKKSGGGHPKEAVTIPIEELQLPKSIITRLAKGVLPPNTQIQANAILAMTKSATVFINHLANAANEVTSLQNKKTIMPADVFRALDDIEFGFMRERVEAEFSKFNETQTTKRSAYRKKVSAAKKATKPAGADAGADTSMAGTDGDTTMAGADTTTTSAAGSSTAGGGGQHRSKKARTDGNDEKMDVDDDVEDASDPESVPDEDEDEEEEEAAEEEEEGEEGDDGNEENDEERDELEEREDRPDEDEALDDGNNSD
ncbi:hypothetical protein VMCG_00981 [Cytospora schulzeri]|uniref:DNA polymerase epsilon subunit D n=1 Tax=Cytospora schulzeri TaxID=448051 RepID=A0A423X6A7_9PEZI|nr:hypothetical protein VMCG_00981 [Valsa malicola]